MSYMFSVNIHSGKRIRSA